MDCMIDLETLEVRPNCVILTIGCVLFDPRGEGVTKKLTVKPDVDEQFALGRSYNDSTINWWATQSQEAQDEAFSTHDRVSFREAIEQVHKFAWNNKCVWSNGAAFDVVVMEDCFLALGMNSPWAYYNVRDTRTVYEMAGVKLSDGGAVTSHRAVDDAERQALLIQRAYKKLGLVK